MSKKVRSRKAKSDLRPVKQRDLKTITKALSQMLVIVILEEPLKVKQLLQLHGVTLTKELTEREMISAIIAKIAAQDPYFNHDLASLIEMTLPELSNKEQYDNFGEKLFKFGGNTRLFGGSGGPATFGGDAGISNSGETSFLDGAKNIGSSTASGAAGGGIVGGILGAVGGIFNHSATVKQQKIQQDEATSKIFSDLLDFKRRGNKKGISKTGTYALVGVSILALIGIIIAVAYNQSKKQAT